MVVNSYGGVVRTKKSEAGAVIDLQLAVCHRIAGADRFRPASIMRKMI